MSNMRSIVYHDVMYAETDRMGIVHHKNYVLWMEMGRMDLLRSVGIDIVAHEAMGYYLPVVDLWCRYKSPAAYGDKVCIETWLKQWQGPLVTFRTVMSAEQKILAIGEVKCALIDQSHRMVEELPESLKRPLKALFGEAEVYAS